ncbi:MAG: hypothetical protein HZB99_00895 [Candidatus Harrisonbacteria bacterium]|nr:hypothetical protein [Candidatus Harrisonbacteria bacterium]
MRLISKKFLIPAIAMWMLPLAASAASSLYFSPASGTYSVGGAFSVSVNVSSPDQAMNAVQAIIDFPKDILSVSSLSKSGSIINFWVEEPTLDNSTGKIRMEGVVLNPGFIGRNGKILQITFKPKAEGTANLTFPSSSVLANDGLGTNILTQIGNAKYVIEPQINAPRLPSPEARFAITSLDGMPVNTPSPRLKFDVRNFDSPIDHYEIRIDSGDFLTWQDDGNHIYTTPQLGPGKHVITVRAYYGADKYLESSIEITVDTLKTPEFLDLPQQLYDGDILVVRGIASPDSKIKISLQKDGDEPMVETVASDSSGNFTLIYKKPVSAGVYNIWAESEDEKGLKSATTEKYKIPVQESASARFQSIFGNIMLVVVLIGLLVLLIAIFYKIKSTKEKLKHSIAESEHALHIAFGALKKYIETRISDSSPDNRELKKEIIKQLNGSEMLVEKEIRDIDKDLEI